MTGTYSDIVEIVAPESALAGSTVNVEVKIKNIWTGSLHLYCVAVADTAVRFIDWQDAWVGPGETQSFFGAFIMGGGDARISAYSHFEGDDGYLHPDDSKTKDVRLAELVPAIGDFTIADYAKV